MTFSGCLIARDCAMRDWQVQIYDGDHQIINYQANQLNEMKQISTITRVKIVKIDCLALNFIFLDCWF